MTKRGQVVSVNYAEAKLLAEILSVVGYGRPEVLSLALKLPQRIYTDAKVKDPRYYEEPQVAVLGEG